MVVAVLLGACGDDPAEEAPGQATTTVQAAPAVTTTTTIGGNSYAADLTTTDGRYRITLAIGSRSQTAGVQDCPATVSAGRYSLPVTLIVANVNADRAAPFPPVRLELAAPAGARPGQVQVRDAAGNCTFSPRVASIGPGGSVVFNGTTPPIEEGAAKGSAGRIEVKVSETTFSLAAPLP